ncbi:element excision factor XisI family protein [Microcystis aeruginosa]
MQQDGTAAAIADKLVARRVPKQDIVLAYHRPHVRQYTEFALG